jgi:predicted dehydrogenase
LVQSGQLGTISQARTEFHYWNQGHGRKWINDPALACGGPLADVGIHCIDALRFILRDEIMRVGTTARSDENSGPMESSAITSLEFANGVLAEVAVSTRAHYRTALEIVGSGGVLTIENAFAVKPDVEAQVTFTPSGKTESRTLSNADSFARQASAFAKAVRGEEAFSCLGEEGLRNQSVLDAAYRSWKSGRREDVLG